MLEVQTVIINADSVEPNVRDSIKAIIKNDKLNNLVRETGKPLFSNIERHLEELSFIKLFPYGRNGLHEYRERPFQRVTPSAYARARVMGSDPRFQSIEYLFYIQSIIEQEQLSSTINVCTRMRENNKRVNNMHVYTMKLRVSSPYSSRSDLIAMITHYLSYQLGSSLCHRVILSGQTCCLAYYTQNIPMLSPRITLMLM